MEIPTSLLNENIPVAINEAARLWEDSVPMPKSSGKSGFEDSQHIRRSENGLWVIRQFQRGLNSTSATREETTEELCDLANKAIDGLIAAGISVISRGNVPSLLGHRIFTITPWIKDMVPVSQQQFYREVDPILEAYYQSAGPLLSDIDKIDQFSVARSLNSKPFLHDADVYTVAPIGLEESA